MPGGQDRGAGARALIALRWLGSPTTVLALVVLLLNDLVWKQQWPGALTGKLSDVAGLLVAAPLLALGLAPVRTVRRPDRWAVAVVAAGFTAMKAAPAGAAAASAAWSLVVPSHVRADATDLLALPVLALALRTARWARDPGPGLRRRCTLAVGTLVLPGAVLGTAATGACLPDDPQVLAVTTVSGRLVTTPPGWAQDVVVSTDFGRLVVSGGALVPPGRTEGQRIQDVVDDDLTAFEGGTREVCSERDLSRCWRTRPTGRAMVETSTDGGVTWVADYSPGTRERRDVEDELGESCGRHAVFAPSDLTVVDTPEGPVVVVALRHAGVAVRSASGGWTRLPVPGTRLDPTPDGPLPTSPPTDPLVPLVAS